MGADQGQHFRMPAKSCRPLFTPASGIDWPTELALSRKRLHCSGSKNLASFDATAPSALTRARRQTSLRPSAARVSIKRCTVDTSGPLCRFPSDDVEPSPPSRSQPYPSPLADATAVVPLTQSSRNRSPKRVYATIPTPAVALGPASIECRSINFTPATHLTVRGGTPAKSAPRDKLK